MKELAEINPSALQRENSELKAALKKQQIINKDSSERLEQLSSLLDNLPGMVFRCRYDKELTFEYASQGAKNILGYSPEEIVSIYTFRQLVHEEDQADNKKIMKGLSPANNRYTMIYRMRSAWGEDRWIHEQGTAIFSDRGTLVAIDGLLTDVTDYKNREIQLREENTRLRFSVNERYRLGSLIGKSSAIQEVYKRIFQAAGSLVPIIIHGESGTGKELAARTIHELSNRKGKPFVAVNCGAIAETLLESEFFGHVRGAFSGAYTDREGYLMAANGGTLFLDEIGEMPIPLQVNLLRVLDGDGFIPVGSNKRCSADFRLISATNRDLGQMVRSGQMRKDFYYRINTVPILMPPLRNRKDDLPLLIDHFLGHFSEQTDSQPQLSPEFYIMLEKHHWPGNIRELQNVIRRFLTLHEISFDPSITTTERQPLPSTDSTPQATLTANPVSDELSQIEKKLILDALSCNHWHMGQTAVALGISRRTLQRRVTKYHLKKT